MNRIARKVTIALLPLIATAGIVGGSVSGASAGTVKFDRIVRPETISNFRTICNNTGGTFKWFYPYSVQTWVEVVCK